MLLVHLSYAVKEIRRRRVRTLANVLGYVVAVAFMIALVSFAQAYSIMEADILRGVGTHFAVYVPAETEFPSSSVSPFFKGVCTESFNMNVVDAVRALPGVKDAAPLLMLKLHDLTIGGIDIDRLATGTTAVSSEEVVDGRDLETTDHNGVLLDEIFASSMGLSVGDNMDAFNSTFSVIGIVNPTLHSKPAGVADMYALIGVVQDIWRLHSGSSDLMEYGDCNVVLVEVAPEGVAEDVRTVQEHALETLEACVGRRGSIAGYGCYAPARNVASITEENAWIVSLILVASVAIFSLKSQFGAVVERTKEIGILKAIGWADSDIMKQVLAESVLQGFAGGVVGVCLGYILTFLVSSFGFISVEGLVVTISPLAIIGGLTAALMGGIVAGIFPAWRAAKLQPAEALRRF